MGFTRSPPLLLSEICDYTLQSVCIVIPSRLIMCQERNNAIDEAGRERLWGECGKEEMKQEEASHLTLLKVPSDL